MTAEFVRKYYIYRIISNPSYYGLTTTDGYVSKQELISRRYITDIKFFNGVEIKLKIYFHFNDSIKTFTSFSIYCVAGKIESKLGFE